MAKNLVIVESPAKAQTIANYLGKDFIVKSSFGHVRDLAKKGISIDIENNYLPNYEISPDKKSVVSELKKIVKSVETVWLATDEDREGEAISWHLYETLGLKDKVTKRITFNEITKSAILNAVEHPREINIDLVNAQQARRVLDRLVGFEISPILWRKVKPSLSAGRVQSVAVRLIVEREREILSFQPESYFKVQGIFNNEKKVSIKAELNSKLTVASEVKDFLEKCKTTNFKVGEVQKKPGSKSPSAPFTTSTLQQEASIKLGFSVTKTMLVAQHLYEAGKITYMRTDSVNLSEEALSKAKNEIVSRYGKEYSHPKKYVTKSASAQEAHEAIRPTDFAAHSIEGKPEEVRLYDLIWKRAISSQMSPASLERTTVEIVGDNLPHNFVARGEVILFDGFLKIYNESQVDETEEENLENESILPPLKSDEKLAYQEITSTQRFSRPSARYVEASLVKKMEELGIGRPSTYAPTISTIQNRGYVEKRFTEGTERNYSFIQLQKGQITEIEKVEVVGREKNKLFPTDIGMVVTDFLIQHFEKIMDYHFTADVEKQFDDIADGLKEWTKMIDDFYHPFHSNVEDTLENSERANGARELGVDPKTNKPVFAKIGRFGPMIQIGGEEDDEEKPRFASLRNGQSIGTITIEEALDLFKLPRVVGQYEGKDVKANVGRFGPYVQVDKTFVSIPKDENPMDISLERAVELFLNKLEEEKKKFIKDFEQDPTIQVLNGRFGPYIKQGRKNYKIPKTQVPEDLTFEQVQALMKEQDSKPTKKRSKK